MPCNERDYAYLRELVLEQSANLIPPSRDALFEARLEPVARQAGLGDLQEFVRMLRSRRPEKLHRAVAEAMMINETSFFRDHHPFELLRTSILPKMIARRAGVKRLALWSAAGSTGQEAYSLAMLVHDHFPELREQGWKVTIIATDISDQSREYAQRARYRRLEVNRGLPARLLLRHFTRDGDEWQVHDNIRSMVKFVSANLCAPLPPLPLFDVVLLRNVLLYFPPQDRGCLLTDVHRAMHEDGALLLGNAEQAEDSTDLFEVEFEQRCFFYRPRAAVRNVRKAA